MRNAIFVLLIFFAFVFASVSFAMDGNLYFVENVLVNVNGKSPSDARNLAVATARKDAFLILLTRLDLDIKIANRVNNEEISDMVRTEQLSDEKVAGNNYSANFSITFAKNFVDHILSQKGKETFFTQENKEIKKLNYLLIPKKINGEKMSLWKENNNWKDAVANVIKKKSSNNITFIIPEIDDENAEIIDKQNGKNDDLEKMKILNNKYASQESYLILFDYDTIDNKVDILMTHFFKSKKQKIKLTFVNVDRLGFSELLKKVSEKVIEYIEKTSNNEISKSLYEMVAIEVPIYSFGDWTMIKNKIENSGLIKQMKVELISRDYAIIYVNYTGNEDIIQSFEKIGIILNKRLDNVYVISK
jgi:hypothetical protein